MQLRQVTRVSFFSQFLCDCGLVPDPLATGSQQEHQSPQNESVWSCPAHLYISLLSTERTCQRVCQRSFTLPLVQL